MRTGKERQVSLLLGNRERDLLSDTFTDMAIVV